MVTQSLVFLRQGLVQFSYTLTLIARGLCLILMLMSFVRHRDLAVVHKELRRIVESVVVSLMHGGCLEFAQRLVLEPTQVLLSLNEVSRDQTSITAAELLCLLNES